MSTCCLSKYYQYLFNTNKSFFQIWSIDQANFPLKNECLEKNQSQTFGNDKNQFETFQHDKISHDIAKKNAYCKKTFDQVETQVIYILKTKCIDESTVNWFYTMLQHTINQIFDFGEIDKFRATDIPIILATFLMENYPVDQIKTMYTLRKKIKDKNRTVMNLCLLFATQTTNINKELKRRLREHTKKQYLHLPGCPYLCCIFNGKKFNKFDMIHYSEYSLISINGICFDQKNRIEIEKACE